MACNTFQLCGLFSMSSMAIERKKHVTMFENALNIATEKIIDLSIKRPNELRSELTNKINDIYWYYGGLLTNYEKLLRESRSNAEVNL